MITCPSCGNQNQDGEAFCAFCAAILQAAPPSAPGAPPPRAPVGNLGSSPGNLPPAPAVPLPPPPPAAPEKKEDTDPGESLDPLDQFLVQEAEKKNGPQEFMVEELGSFSSNFDNLEDQLEDAHRAAVLKQKMAAIHAKEGPAAGGDKLDQLDAILDLELEKAKQAAMEESSTPGPSSRSASGSASYQQKDEGSEQDRLAKLEKYKKFLEMPGMGGSATSGGNELIRYLEAKVQQQTVEIERLKEQKQELVAEVFNDALSEEHDTTKEELAKAKKEIERLETKISEMQAKRVSYEEKLMAKGEQVQKLMEERQRLLGNQDAIRAQVEEQLGQQAQQVKVKLQQVEAQYAVQGQEMATLRDQISRQTQMMAKVREELETTKATLAEAQTKGGASTEEVDRYKKQITALQQRVKKTMSAGATQLKALANYYEVILNHISEIVIVFDTDENIMLINRAARALLQIPPQAPIKGKLGDFEPLAPVIPAAERAIGTDHTLHGGELMIKLPTRADSSFRLSFCPIVFPGREAFLLIMEEVSNAPAARELPPGAGLAEHQLAALKEQIFSLKILAEIMAAKPDRKEVVEESANELKKEINHILELLNDPNQLV